MLERTYEYRMYPTATEQKRFELIADTVRALYNQMLKDRTEHYRNTGSWKRLDPKPFVQESLLMKELEPSVIKWTQANLNQAYRNFFHIKNSKLDRFRADALQKAKEVPGYQLMDTDLVGYPRIKNKTSKESWNIGTKNVELSQKRVQIPGMGNVKLHLHRPVPQEAKITHYTILKKPSGHFFLLVHLQLPEAPQLTHYEKAIGVALMPNKLAECSDGLPVRFRHQTCGQSEKMEKAYKKLSRMTPGSNRYEKQRRYLASLYERRSNQRRDDLHKAAKAITDNADVISIESPQVMRKKKRLSKLGAFETVLDEAWWTFSKYIKYKAVAQGKRFWRAPEPVPIRNACSVCGVIAEVPQKDDTWFCTTCTATMPAGRNAAINLKRFGDIFIKQWNEKAQ